MIRKKVRIDILGSLWSATVGLACGTAVSVTGLTIYDMLKAVDKSMQMGGIRVILKDGGKSGRYEAE